MADDLTKTLERELAAVTRERDEARAEVERLREDAERLDWADKQWTNPIHIEVGTKKGPYEESYVRACTVYMPNSEHEGKSIRAAIDAARKEQA